MLKREHNWIENRRFRKGCLRDFALNRDSIHMCACVYQGSESEVHINRLSFVWIEGWILREWKRRERE